MKTVIINNVDEMRQYYNSATNTYDFQENGQPLSIVLMNDFITKASIKAKNITAKDITALNIDALNITARDISVDNIFSKNINAREINCYDTCVASENIKCKSIIGGRNDD